MLRIVVAFILALVAAAAIAQDGYPNKPIQMIVPFPSYELKELAPIALISADPTVLVVRADGPYKTKKIGKVEEK